MKSNIHPTYYPDATVTCVCGNKFTTGSTLKDIHLDICSKCHPFYTGEMRFVDTLGNVDKFLKKQAAAVGYTPKAKKARTHSASEYRSLKEMLSSQKAKPSTAKVAKKD